MNRLKTAVFGLNILYFWLERENTGSLSADLKTSIKMRLGEHDTRFWSTLPTDLTEFESLLRYHMVSVISLQIWINVAQDKAQWLGYVTVT